MDKEIIKSWEENKDRIREYISKTEQSKYSSYKSLVKLIIKYVVNTKEKLYNEKKIRVVDSNGYHGIQIFLVPEIRYEVFKYLTTCVNYGSCSGCDTLISIQNYGLEIPSEEQVNDYMTLLLHLVQNIKIIGESEKFI